MNTSLLKVDLRILPKIIILLILLVYPLFCYLGYKIIDKNEEIFVLVCLSYLLFRVYEIYKEQSNFVMPLYIVIFGLFLAYTIICGMFMSNYISERGIRYFYSDPLWITFIALIIVENTQFSFNTLRFAKKILVITLILASVVSIIQISNPLFFVKDEIFVEGLSYDRMKEYYKNIPNWKIGANWEAGMVNRTLAGYRPSIFSYIDPLAVGMDTIAIFSILITWKPTNIVEKGLYTITAAIISFLSSSRWIILGFIVVASHTIWVGKKKLSNLIHFIFLGGLLLINLGLIANFMGFDVEEYVYGRMMSEDATSRLLAFEVFFEVFPDNPIFGTGGVDTDRMLSLLGGRSSQIHVGFLKLFYYYGLIGGLLYLSFMAAILHRLRKMALLSGYWGGFFAILTFFIANLTLFELSLFYYGPILAIIFANHFYFNKINDKTITTLNNNQDFSISK